MKKVLRRFFYALMFLIALNIITPSLSYSGTYAATRYPIVLVPGVTGFDKLLGCVDYWYGISSDLTANGAKVLEVALTAWNGDWPGDVLPGTDPGAIRGPELENIILNFMNGNNQWHQHFDKVNIIAHSQGSTTARYFLNRHADKVASITTIAGPHKGTPTADFGMTIQNPTQSIIIEGINFFMGDLINFISGNWGYIGTNNTKNCVYHFSYEGISKFNQAFPCPALPYNMVNGKKVYCEGINGGYGSKCNTAGAQSGTMPGFSNTIYFYSWTGNVGLGSVTNILDPLDNFLIATSWMNMAYGYFGDADGFIPVSSAKFGKFQGTYYWNHLDEINQTLGLLFPFVSDPVAVVRTHANTLKNNGL